MEGESISECEFLTSPDSRSPSTANSGSWDGFPSYGTTAATSCLIWDVEAPMPKPPATRAR